jgi:hypothetical protein
MDMERPTSSRTDGSMRYMPNWTDLSPTQAGLAAALRRAFEVPADETQRKFEELVRNLS